MIDRLQRIARRVRLLRRPAIALAIASAVAMVAIPLFSHSKGWDQWFIPSFVALLWGLSTASFITTFHTVPAADGSLRFFARLKRRFARAWYWFIGMAFLVTSSLSFHEIG